MPISASMVELIYSLHATNGYQLGQGHLKTLSRKNQIQMSIYDETWVLSIALDFGKGVANVKGVVKGKWQFINNNLETFQDLQKSLWYFRKVIKQHLGSVLTSPYPPGHLKAMFGYYPDLGIEVNSNTLKKFEIDGDRWLVHESEKVVFRVEETFYKTGTPYTRVILRQEHGKAPIFYSEKAPTT